MGVRGDRLSVFLKSRIHQESHTAQFNNNITFTFLLDLLKEFTTFKSTDW